jgi:hypothetical protein
MAQIILDSNNNLIQGDFDNATLNNRTKLQTTTTNATTNVYVAPNGSSTSAGVSVANNSSLTNASKIVMATNGTTDTQIISGVNGSGSYLPLSFYTNNTLAMQITTAGNILVAATAAPAFSAYLGAEQSISSATFTKVALSSELFDTASAFDSSTNYRFTPQVAGYYQINAFARVIGVSATNKILAIYKNGSPLYSFDSFTPSTISFNGSFTPMVISATIYCNGSTDYIELYGYSNGSSTSFAGGGGGTNVAPWYTYMTGFLARSA